MSRVESRSRHLTRARKPPQLPQTAFKLPGKQTVLARIAHGATRGRHWALAFGWLVIGALLPPLAGAQESAIMCAECDVLKAKLDILRGKDRALTGGLQTMYEARRSLADDKHSSDLLGTAYFILQGTHISLGLATLPCAITKDWLKGVVVGSGALGAYVASGDPVEVTAAGLVAGVGMGVAGDVRGLANFMQEFAATGDELKALERSIDRAIAELEGSRTRIHAEIRSIESDLMRGACGADGFDLDTMLGVQGSTETPPRTDAVSEPPSTADVNPPVSVATTPRLEPLCQGVADEAPCWRAVANQPGCHVWDAYPAARETVNFDSASTCPDGWLNGRGKTTWNWYDADAGWQSSSGDGSWLDGNMGGPWVLEFADGDVWRGPFVDGKQNGPWVLEFADGGVQRGPYVDGQRHGPWVLEFADGDVHRGPFVDSQRSGQWVFEVADGGVQRGPYVDGKKHGPWVHEFADGGVQRGPYVDGQRHGPWVLEFADGDVHRGPFVDSQRSGQWVFEVADGGVQRGPYVDGKKHGPWVLEFADGGVERGPYVDGKKHGPWVLEFADGDVHRGPFVDSQRSGLWVLEFASGSVYRGPYVDGERSGQWVQEFADGDVWRGPYVDGKMHGQWVIENADGTVMHGRFVHGELQVD